MMAGQNLKSIDSCDLTNASKRGRLFLSALIESLNHLIGRDVTNKTPWPWRKSELMMYKALNEERRVRLGCLLEVSLLFPHIVVNSILKSHNP